MKHDETFEEHLRATFIAKAEEIDRGPGWPGATGSEAARRSDSVVRRWRTPVLAAAAVAAIAVVATAMVTHGFRSDTDPAAGPGGTDAAHISVGVTSMPTSPSHGVDEHSNETSPVEALSSDVPSTRTSPVAALSAETELGDSGAPEVETSDTQTSDAPEEAETAQSTDPEVPASREKVCQRWWNVAYYGGGPGELLVHHLAGKAVPMDLIHDTTLNYKAPKTQSDDPELTGRIDRFSDEAYRLRELPEDDWTWDDVDSLAQAYSRVLQLCGSY